MPNKNGTAPLRARRCSTLYEVESKGRYHEHWLAFSPLDAARRAVSHARECGVTLDRMDVSSMVQPEEAGKGGLVYVVNDTRTYFVSQGRVKRGARAVGLLRSCCGESD